MIIQENETSGLLTDILKAVGMPVAIKTSTSVVTTPSIEIQMFNAEKTKLLAEQQKAKQIQNGSAVDMVSSITAVTGSNTPNTVIQSIAKANPLVSSIGTMNVTPIATPTQAMTTALSSTETISLSDLKNAFSGLRQRLDAVISLNNLRT